MWLLSICHATIGSSGSKPVATGSFTTLSGFVPVTTFPITSGVIAFVSQSVTSPTTCLTVYALAFSAPGGSVGEVDTSAVVQLNYHSAQTAAGCAAPQPGDLGGPVLSYPPLH
jgi:hypothetical protein